MRTQVSREKLRIKQKPQEVFEPGAIFFYNGPFNRLKGFVLVHQINPRLDALSARDGRDIYADDHVVAEVLIPEKNYSDYCVFWIEKRYLKVPDLGSFKAILSAIAN